MIDFTPDHELAALRDILDEQESVRLHPFATLSRDSIRRRPEEKAGHRQSFSLDCDRILHSRAYTRYIDKTQVFSLVTNDHISHRVLHVQLVSKIARTVGRFLGLNEDLIEAIALAHDLGHPPFGHEGERLLSDLCLSHGIPEFHHNIQSVVFMDRIEKGGRGWNLSLQVLDGILFHDGETHSDALRPYRTRGFEEIDRIVSQKDEVPLTPEQRVPMTLEGCVVRVCDTIGYIGRDIEDAIELELISREDIPEECVEVLGPTNGTMVYRLVADLIRNGCREDRVSLSPEISKALAKLKRFNYERIYLNPVIKAGFNDIASCYQALFTKYLDDVRRGEKNTEIYREFLSGMGEEYLDSFGPAVKVRDFISGMTDEYLLVRAAELGCRVPRKVVRPVAG
ncbi:MAG: HD domain-containing protein [Proteobacteria bacterium]|nr:HD domain-containing protein [Pseudomonadota bacterium]MBU1738510.1 HD domain-containing protein [Pseudomonadota bacterium]